MAKIVFFVVENAPKIKDRIPTGEYVVNKEDTVFTVIKNMLAKDVAIRKITIPEGYTVAMILEELKNNELLLGEITKIPQEATLMPDTYFYRFGDSKVSIVSKMKNQMNKVLSLLSAQNKTGLSMEEILILASLIEKETSIEEERVLISSVFHNRLAKKMRLESDPTVIYALSNGYGKIDRKLARSDLFADSAFNTYRHAGLPPTAICCPGEKSILAAMNPAKTNYLYFVAKKEGKEHWFSSNYKDHLARIKERK
ncbi:MAG: endolytic transglycosylase MltG [Holosporales bacterium]|nr:endolytic transglycosylase MltG [Holosporales bacterium]